MNAVDRAYVLLNARRGVEAVAVLEQAGRSGDADALVELALWSMQGAVSPRDLPRSRALFGQAGALGHAQARMVHLSLIAQGVGGPPDWRQALTLLRGAGDTGDAAAGAEVALIAAMALDDTGAPAAPPVAQILSTEPDVRLFDQLLTEEEARALIERGKPMLQPSVVIDSTTGRTTPHPVRTSDNADFPYVLETPFIHALNRRFAAASGTDVTAGEPLQLLRYRPGQQYRPHFDALTGTDNQRVLTMIAYLNDGYSGGETQFVATGLKVTGRTGDVLMFRNALADGRPDPRSQHAGLPVTRGEKFIATRWIRQHPFGPR